MDPARMVRPIINSSDRIEYTSMFDNISIHFRICQSLLSEIRIHQPLQIIQMPRHPLDARILFLELLMQQKCLLQNVRVGTTA